MLCVCVLDRPQTFEKFYETDSTRELLTETRKVLISKIKMLQFNLKGSIQRES
ncbi:hypothetical protein HanPI659440_Chr07g0269401 [Helianthus annuus]|nr:hypothetical protein HanPI659440_Chr07g0269401 [Helianthus annuus]